MGETIFAVVAFYFLLLALRFMFGPINDSSVLLGDLFASLALTFFWAMRRKSQS